MQVRQRVSASSINLSFDTSLATNLEGGVIRLASGLGHEDLYLSDRHPIDISYVLNLSIWTALEHAPQKLCEGVDGHGRQQSLDVVLVGIPDTALPFICGPRGQYTCCLTSRSGECLGGDHCRGQAYLSASRTWAESVLATQHPETPRFSAWPPCEAVPEGPCMDGHSEGISLTISEVRGLVGRRVRTPITAIRGARQGPLSTYRASRSRCRIGH